MVSKKQSLTGQHFGRWTVIGEDRVPSSRGKYKWECRCECGTIKFVLEFTLLNGGSKSCSCFRNELMYNLLAHAPGEASKNKILNNYKKGADKRKLCWELDTNYVLELMKSKCYYCGRPPSTVCDNGNKNGKFVYNGIDRLNNDIGYTFVNCVPCCSKCNYAKGKMSEYEFKEVVRRIYNHIMSGVSEYRLEFQKSLFDIR
jgi:hypothetical protein